jgi:hypothetical protein
VTILVPESLLEEFVEKAENEKLSEIITEALTEELKRLRFRRDLKRAQKADQE